MDKINGSIKSTDIIKGNLTNQNNIRGNIVYPNGIEIRDYELLFNKPQIETVELIGNKSFDDLGLSKISVNEINSILI